MLGPTSLLISNFAIIFSTNLLRGVGSASPSMAIAIFACANLIVGGVAGVFRLKDLKILGHSLAPAIVSGFCIAAAFSLMLLQSNRLNLSHLFVAEAIPPFLGAFALRRWTKNSLATSSDILYSSVAVVVLLIIASLAWRNTAGSFDGAAACLFFMLIICFTGSQVSMRLLSEKIAPTTASSVVTTITGLSCLSFVTMMDSVSFSFLGRYEVLLIAIGIFVTQFFFLKGLQRCSPIKAAVFISSSVPLSVLCDAINGKSYPWTTLGLSVFYMVIVALRVRF